MTVSGWNTEPAWFHIVALLQVLPAASLDGWLRERQGVVAQTPAVL